MGDVSSESGKVLNADAIIQLSVTVWPRMVPEASPLGILISTEQRKHEHGKKNKRCPLMPQHSYRGRYRESSSCNSEGSCATTLYIIMKIKVASSYFQSQADSRCPHRPK